MNSTLSSLFGGKVAAAVKEAQTFASVEHAGVRGRLREILVQELIRPLIPPTWEVMTGLLVDHVGAEAENQSGQEDILVYSQDLLPGGFRASEVGVLPIEACLAVIEVKSNLTSQEVRSAIEHSRRIRSLATIYEKVLEEQQLSWTEKVASRPLYSVFALNTDIRTGAWSKWARVEREHQNLGLEYPVLFAVCSVDVGCAFWYGPELNLAPRDTQSSDGNHSESISFFSFLTDYVRKIEQIKKTRLPFPVLSHYLLPND